MPKARTVNFTEKQLKKFAKDIADGLTVSDIARSYNIGPKTLSDRLYEAGLGDVISQRKPSNGRPKRVEDEVTAKESYGASVELNNRYLTTLSMRSGA